MNRRTKLRAAVRSTAEPPAAADNDPVTSYARQVVSGKIVANKWVRLACQRHLSDLSRTDLFWDLPAALHHIGFFHHVLRLPFKEEPYIRPFALLPHQMFTQGSLFGWKKLKPDGSVGYRRFNYVYVETGKGSGKSPLGAGTCHYMCASDGEPQAECYVASGDKDQAYVAFDHVVSMHELSPELKVRQIKSGEKKCHQVTYAHAQKESERRLLGSFIRPIASDNTQAGPRPHFVLIDELHEIVKTAVVEMMRKAIGKNREQSMVYEITNSGVDRQSICYQHRQQAERMLDGTTPNDLLFAFICGLDEGDIPEGVDELEYLLEHRELWVKANPGIGLVPSYEYVEKQILDAIGLPSQRNLVLRLHFCIWTDAISVWIPDETWMAGADARLAEKVEHPQHGTITRLEYELLGRRCYGGIDLARSNDWSSLVLIFPDDDGEISYPSHERIVDEAARISALSADEEESEDGRDTISLADPNNQTYSILEYFWIDEETFKERRKKTKLIEVWDRESNLIITPGSVFNPGHVQRFILDKIAPRYQIDGIAYDRTFAHQIVTNLSEKGLVMVEWAPTFWWMGAPVGEIARRCKAKLWRHRGHPVMRWMFRNVMIETDPGGLQRINKARSVEKVDGPVALAYALGWCMRANKGRGGSVYEERGPIVIEDAYF